MDKKSNIKNRSENRSDDITKIDYSSKIYTIRGQKVMLDYDLAEIYGYETRYLNRQVFRNKEKFEDNDFMFQLTRAEVENLVMCQFVTSPKLFAGQDGGTRKLPYAFTESGVYMLMTVLKGELATRQSKALIRTFRAMKEYILESEEALAYKENLQLVLKISKNTQEISMLKNEILKLESKINNVEQKASNALTKSEIHQLIQDFSKEIERREYILMDGKPMNASEVYINIYKSAKKSIHIIDNYIDIRTLRHLQKVKLGTKITIFTDNLGNYLHRNDYENFQKEYPGLNINFIKTNGRIHDRFIVLDCGLKSETIYHSGASEKDGGGKMSAITKLDDNDLKEKFREIILELGRGPKLILK